MLVDTRTVCQRLIMARQYERLLRSPHVYGGFLCYAVAMNMVCIALATLSEIRRSKARAEAEVKVKVRFKSALYK